MEPDRPTSRALREFVEEVVDRAEVPEDIREEARQDFLAHLETHVAALRARGYDERRAIDQSIAQFGSARLVGRTLRAVATARETSPVVRRRRSVVEWLGTVRQDIVFSWRAFRKAPLIPLVIFLTVGLGLGATTAVLTVVHGVLVQPLAFPDPDRLMAVGVTAPESPGGVQVTSPGNFIDWRAQASAFEHLAAYSLANVAISGGDEAERVSAMAVSWDFLETLGVRPLHGRGFTPDEERPAASNVVLLGHGLWQRRFGGRRDVIGSTIVVNETSASVIGILPPRFRLRWDAEMWVPLPLVPGQSSRGANFVSVIGRLGPAVTLAEARSDMGAIANGLHRDYPQFFGDHGISVVPLQDFMVSDVRASLLVVLGAVGLVFLIVCANVANLLVARSDARTAEFAIRTSLGAGTGRILRQLGTETMLLIGAGGLLGLGAAVYLVKTFLAFSPTDFPRLGEIRIDGAVFAFAIVLTVGTALIVTTVPALRFRSRHLASLLTTAGRGGSGGASGERFRAIVVIVQVAVCLILLTNAALLVRSFVLLRTVNPGLDTANLLTFNVELSGARYASNPARAAYLAEGVARLRSLPAVHGAASTGFRPGSGGFTRRFALDDRPVPDPGEYFLAIYNPASPGYFETVGIPVLRGRSFLETDRAGAPAVAIVNEAFTRTYYSDADPIGQRLGFYQGGVPQPDAFEIVGVVGDVRFDGLARDPRPAIYIPQAQSPWRWATFYVRTAGESSAMIPAVRQLFATIDPSQPIFSILPMRQVLEESTVSERALTVVLSIFAGVALILALSGVFGLMSFVVSQRTRELGVRLALGAVPGTVRRGVLRRGLTLVAAGAIIGLAGALATAQLLEGTLFGIAVTDPVTYVAAVTVLLLVSTVAMYIPARRASTIDPMIALRTE